MTRTQNSKEEKVMPKKRGSDEIDSIFSAKRKQKQETVVIPNKTKKAVDGTAASSSRAKGNRSVLESVFAKPGSKEWVDDGLGGRFNAEGYTGRVEDGVKVFKAHVLNRPQAGCTKDCPFDCDCCFI